MDRSHKIQYLRSLRIKVQVIKCPLVFIMSVVIGKIESEQVKDQPKRKLRMKTEKEDEDTLSNLEQKVAFLCVWREYVELVPWWYFISLIAAWI